MSTPLRERPDAPLGTLIFRAGLLPAETIESALEEGVKTGKRLGEILTERGLISEVDLARLLAGQKGLEFVTLREQIVDPSAAALFTEEQARLFRALPYSFDGELPVVAIADPTDDVLIRNIREALGREDARFVVTARGELADIATDVYSRPLPVGPEPADQPGPSPEAAHVNGHAPAEADLVFEPTAEPEAAPAAPEPEPVATEPEPVATEPTSDELEPAALQAPVEEPAEAVAPETPVAPEPAPPAAFEPPSAPEYHPEPEPEPSPSPSPSRSLPQPASPRLRRRSSSRSRPRRPSLHRFPSPPLRRSPLPRRSPCGSPRLPPSRTPSPSRRPPRHPPSRSQPTQCRSPCPPLRPRPRPIRRRPQSPTPSRSRRPRSSTPQSRSLPPRRPPSTRPGE